MIFKETIKTLAIAALMFTGIQTTQAQDILARQAPVDRKMKAVDTLALRNLIDREQAEMPGIDLYEDWNNKYAHKATELPDSFRIDMRHFCMPTPSRVITSGFGARWGRQHKGLDIKVYIGDTIRAAFSGKVRIVRYEAAGYGNYVVIRHNNGLETIYGHLSKHLCHENQIVKAGDVIGLGGNTGRSTGSHLHFETRICGVALNPALLFDFVNQDVTCDSYMFRSTDYVKANRSHTKYAKRQITKGNADDTIDAIAALDNNKKDRKARRQEKKTAKQEAKVEKLEANGEEKDVKAENLDAKSQKKLNKKAAKKAAAKSKTHKVVKGESLYSIARKNGVTIDELCRKNGIKKTDILGLGQKLKI